MSGGDRFLTRWSRRKQAAGDQTAGDQKAGEAPARPDAPEAPGAAPVPDPRTDEQILTDLGLPDPTTLKPGDDVRGFMQAAVPDRLRRLALRQLWRSNPVLANLDRLVDYGEDYTDAATVVANLQTAYQVGRGFWTDEDERLAVEKAAREAAAEKTDREAAGDAAAPEVPAPDGAGPDEANPDEANPDEAGGIAAAGAADGGAGTPDGRAQPGPDAPARAAMPDPDASQPQPAAPPRRMTFRYRT